MLIRRRYLQFSTVLFFRIQPFITALSRCFLSFSQRSLLFVPFLLPFARQFHFAVTQTHTRLHTFTLFILNPLFICRYFEAVCFVNRVIYIYRVKKNHNFVTRGNIFFLTERSDFCRDWSRRMKFFTYLHTITITFIIELTYTFIWKSIAVLYFFLRRFFSIVNLIEIS